MPKHHAVGQKYGYDKLEILQSNKKFCEFLCVNALKMADARENGRHHIAAELMEY